MELPQIKSGLTGLGRLLKAAGEASYNDLQESEKNIAGKLEQLIYTTIHDNRWFSEHNTRFAYLAFAEMLLSLPEDKFTTKEDLSKTIAVIPSGIAPLEGLKDITIALLSRFKVQYKQMHKDEKLMPAIIEALQQLQPGFREILFSTEGKLTRFDKVIVTIPSDRKTEWQKYFSRYSGKIRRIKHGAAIITGRETLNELEALGNDIFRYFGRTFYNVYKLYIPEDYNISLMYEGLQPYEKEMKAHTNYFNHFEYNKSIFLLNRENNADNGFLIFRKSRYPESRTGVLHYERYRDKQHLQELVDRDAAQLSLLVCKDENLYPEVFPPGTALHPSLNDKEARDTLRKIND